MYTQILELRDLLAVVPPAPWRAEGDLVKTGEQTLVALCWSDEEQERAIAKLISAAVNALPALLDLVDAARAEACITDPCPICDALERLGET